MANLTRTFHLGKMNKTLNERLVPVGEYLDATNIRVSSSEGSEGGVVENAKGNVKLTDITIDGQSPVSATCTVVTHRYPPEPEGTFLNHTSLGPRPFDTPS